MSSFYINIAIYYHIEEAQESHIMKKYGEENNGEDNYRRKKTDLSEKR